MMTSTRGSKRNTGACEINTRPRRWDHNINFAPAPPKFKVERNARRWFHEIGRWFCTQVHSLFSLRQHWYLGERGLRVIAWTGQGREFHEPGFWHLFWQSLCGFVVSANLRNIVWSFYRGTCKSPQISAILRKTSTKNCATKYHIPNLPCSHEEMRNQISYCHEEVRNQISYSKFADLPGSRHSPGQGAQKDIANHFIIDQYMWWQSEVLP